MDRQVVLENADLSADSADLLPKIESSVVDDGMLSVNSLSLKPSTAGLRLNFAATAPLAFYFS